MLGCLRSLSVMTSLRPRLLLTPMSLSHFWACDITCWRLEANVHELSMVLADYKNTLGQLTLIEDGIMQLEAGTDPDKVEAEVQIEVDAGDTEDGALLPANIVILFAVDVTKVKCIYCCKILLQL